MASIFCKVNWNIITPRISWNDTLKLFAVCAYSIPCYALKGKTSYKTWSGKAEVNYALKPSFQFIFTLFSSHFTIETARILYKMNWQSWQEMPSLSRLFNVAKKNSCLPKQVREQNMFNNLRFKILSELHRPTLTKSFRLRCLAL